MDIDIKVTYKNESLKKVRLAAGLSQSQLSAATGINVRMIQYYEQGVKDLNAAKLTTLLKLCNALKCSLPDILTDPETLDLLAVYDNKGVQNDKV